jgi:peptidoglycan/xylan/chitin deacetylase (PgdA/CDA1 family)
VMGRFAKRHPSSNGVLRRQQSRMRKVAQWLALRDTLYIGVRLVTLIRRYGVTASLAKKRTLECVEMLARFDCRPTFMTPGQVVGWHSSFCRRLQGLGAELAVHGYHHLDFRALSVDESRTQFTRAAAAYQRNGITFEGFRCPYLSYTPQLDELLPDGAFQYSSNKAIWWDVVSAPSGPATGDGARAIFDGLSRFYQASLSRTHVAVPHRSGHLVEIPVCLPDDLQLLDGLKLDERAIGHAWVDVLHRTHRRGELFDLMFHPESFAQCGAALQAVLQEARALDPPVWVSQLRDINRWWREKASFTVESRQGRHGLQLAFHCSDRATVLVRNLDIAERTHDWHGSYRVLAGRTLQLRSDVRPFVGIAADTPPAVALFLRDQGYVVDTGPEAARSATYLGPRELADLRTQVQLTEFIETSAAPLVRFWRWPANARSALCITGDLDALSLTGYIARVFAL